MGDISDPFGCSQYRAREYSDIIGTGPYWGKENTPISSELSGVENGNKPISSDGAIIDNGNIPPLPFTFGPATNVKGNGMAPNILYQCSRFLSHEKLA